MLALAPSKLYNFQPKSSFVTQTVKVAVIFTSAVDLSLSLHQVPVVVHIPFSSVYLSHIQSHPNENSFLSVN